MMLESTHFLCHLALLRLVADMVTHGWSSSWGDPGCDEKVGRRRDIQPTPRKDVLMAMRTVCPDFHGDEV